MKAIGYRRNLPIADPSALVAFTAPDPVAAGRDVLARVEAISVNPVDVKIRAGAPAAGEAPRILGWDVAGTVVAVGPHVRRFAPGDKVFYAGAVDRPGANAELHLVDERIVGRAPASLSPLEAAALPLTAITAWEALFDRLDVRRPVAGAAPAVLIVGGAGGVGSIAIQIAKRVAGLAVIATASRPESQAHARAMGADHVVDHAAALAPQIAALGIGAPSFVLSTTRTDQHFDDLVELLAPQGRLALIDDPGPLDVRKLKRKSLSLHWEMMFTRSLSQTADMAAQGALLDEVARLVDAGALRTTLTQDFGRLDVATLRLAHAAVESGRMIGKAALWGF
jgi:zinc-binding alcohol dehydrogenase family protein